MCIVIIYTSTSVKLMLKRNNFQRQFLYAQWLPVVVILLRPGRIHVIVLNCSFCIFYDQFQWRFVVVKSSFKRVFSKTNVSLRCTVVVGRNCSLIHNRLDQTFFGHWALFFYTAVPCAFFARRSGLGQFGLLVSIGGLFNIGHATVAYFNCVACVWIFCVRGGLPGIHHRWYSKMFVQYLLIQFY